MRETCDLYDNPEAYANELQKVEQEEHDSSYESEVCASKFAIEILISSLQPTRKSPIKKQLKKKREKKKYPNKKI
jgi:hypothetical protein